MGKYKSFKPIGKIAIFVSIFLNEVHDMEIGINCINFMFVEQEKNNHWLVGKELVVAVKLCTY